MWLRAAGRTRQTIETRTGHVRMLARAMDGAPAEVTGVQLVRWASDHDWARETRRSIYNSIRAFFRWAVAEGWTATDPTGSLPPVKSAPPRPRPAPDAAYRDALLRADERTALILRMAAEAGLRRAEIAGVHRTDLVERNNFV